jgi:hypothetical protein
MCPPSGNQVDGLPLAPRRSATRSENVFSRSDEVSDVHVLVNVYFLDSYYIEASIKASECLK